MVLNLDLEFQGMLLRTSGIDLERPEGGGGMNQLRVSESWDLCLGKANRFRETEVKKINSGKYCKSLIHFPDH